MNLKKGFTLVELLAVIVILAIIALIAIPQVLHLIEESRISSLEISASEYIRAVEASFMNEEINRNVEDGLYTIIDNGKAIELNGNKIQIETSGNRIESGGLLVENKKVVRIIKGEIKDYYARIEQEDMKLYKNIKESMLLSGMEFNKNIKQLVGNIDATSGTQDTIVKEIIFLPESMLPKGITKEELTSFKSVSLSDDGEIIAYYDNNGTVYVYSENLIQTNTNASFMFNMFAGLTNITFNLLDTSKTTNMRTMFSGCSNLKEINFEKSFDTSNVNIMQGMFNGCKSLKELDLSSFNTSKVTEMDQMFESCKNLKELDLSKFKTSKVIEMSRMFFACSNLIELNLTSFDTSKVTTMESMFSGCSSLTELDLSSFDISSVTKMEHMFDVCNNLKEILVSRDKWIIKEEISDADNMFNKCGVDHVTYIDE